MDAYTLDKIEFDAVRRILSGFCSCSLGRKAALTIAPSAKIHVVQQWVEQTTEMVEVVRETGLPPLGGAGDISDALTRAVPGHGGSVEDFSEIADTLTAIGNCRVFLRSLPERLKLIHALAGGLGNFSAEVEAIRAIIAPDGEIRDDASARMGELRREIAATTQKIHDVIHSYLRNPEVKKLLTGAHVTLHGDRYVLPVRVDNRGRLPGVVHRASNTGQTVFVEPNASVELNNHLVDLHDHKRQEIERLLSDLGVKITARLKSIRNSLRTLGQLDLLSAKAQYAYQFDMTAPTITHRKGLEFFRARHPLLEAASKARDSLAANPNDPQTKTAPAFPHGSKTHQAIHSVVPIDVRLGSDFDILVITGSNTGGKTVAMKTVALLVAMAQSGMHLPVQRGARLSVFDDVLIDIGDEQSLEQSLSTFGGHIERLKYILGRLKKNGQNCLVLLDELGSGTDPDEGGAIGQALLDELQRLGCLAMVSTHFSILKAYALNHDRVDNASVEFDTRTLGPTYHLRIGTPGESHAITVAEKLGLPKRVTDAARGHMSKRGSQFRKALRLTGAARQQAEAARADAAAAQVQAQGQAEAFEEKIADVARLKEDFTTWLARINELKPGDELLIPATGKAATLVRLELHKQIALVEQRGMQREIPLAELMPDVGQTAVRQQMTAIRQDASARAASAEEQLAEAQRLRDEAKKAEKQHKDRAKQFDAWLGRIARVKIGDEITISQKPGRGKLVKIDFAGLRATVELAGGKIIQLSLQDIFPQIGPFAARSDRHHAAGKPRRKPAGSAKSREDKNRPIPHGKTDGKAAAKNRQAVLATPPGQKVYVVPFKTAATLVRIDKAGQKATVLRGAFEIQIPLSDLEPVGYPKATTEKKG
ncbi:MAG: hypothetical protein K8S55_09690 [Phycisphaerae bacterium]|nr:hypothetical protein [Phycisphaerae bacterium]